MIMNNASAHFNEQSPNQNTIEEHCVNCCVNVLNFEELRVAMAGLLNENCIYAFHMHCINICIKIDVL